MRVAYWLNPAVTSLADKILESPRFIRRATLGTFMLSSTSLFRSNTFCDVYISRASIPYLFSFSLICLTKAHSKRTYTFMQQHVMLVLRNHRAPIINICKQYSTSNEFCFPIKISTENSYLLMQVPFGARSGSQCQESRRGCFHTLSSF